MRLKSIQSRLDTCPRCNFTALFMYKDISGQALCPKCNKADIRDFKRLMTEISNDDLFQDDLELVLDDESSLDYDDFKELNF